MGATRIFCGSETAEVGLELERLEGDVLGGDEEFTGERGFGGTAAEGFFCGESDKIRIVVFLRYVGEDEVADAGIETLRIGEKFADSVIGEMAGAGENALLDNPGIGADLEHVQIVIGFEDEAIGLAKMDSYVIWEVAEIGADRDFGAVGTEGESDGVGGVVGNRECVDVDVADRETLAGLDGLDASEALAECVGQDALERVHGGLGDVERRFPESEDLREAVTVVRVFMSDENGIEMINVALDGGEAGESFALSKAGVNEDAGAFGFEQG
jgi:hypothetical protein